MTLPGFKQAGGPARVLAAWADIDVEQASGDFGKVLYLVFQN